MPFCPNCGSQINVGDRFCSNCGMGIHAVTGTVATTVNPVNNARSDYRIVIISRGTCSRAVAIDMLGDMLGYSDAEAARIIDNVPMEAALGLTAIQAQYISQAITEYGMQVAIYNSDGYVDMGSRATSSVYDSEGSFLGTVASVLAGLGIANRISSFNRWTQPQPLLFRPAYRRSTPMSAYHRRRPAPKPIPVVHHATPPIPRNAPIPTPAPPRSVAGSRPQPVHPAPRPVGPVVTPRPVGPAAAPRPNGPATAPRPVGPQGGPNGTGRGRGGQGGPIGPGGSRRG